MNAQQQNIAAHCMAPAVIAHDLTGKSAVVQTVADLGIPENYRPVAEAFLQLYDKAVAAEQVLLFAPTWIGATGYPEELLTTSVVQEVIPVGQCFAAMDQFNRRFLVMNDPCYGTTLIFQRYGSGLYPLIIKGSHAHRRDLVAAFPDKDVTVLKLELLTHMLADLQKSPQQ